jgi:5'-nucleotidase / UDP-sugar diphosphatase
VNLKRFVALAAVLVAALYVPGCAARAASPGTTATASAPAAGTVDVTIFHLNDPHGRLEPYQLDGKSVGGYARISTLVNEERAAGKAARVFLVHVGDEFSRGDELTVATRGAANVAILNLLKFDLWVPGNGEFYQPLDVLDARLAETRFPVLAANIKRRETGLILGQPYILSKAGPVRIAFLGLCVLKPAAGMAVESFDAADPIETARKLVPELRKQADVVVAVTHIGSDVDRKLAASVAGIDVILGGHTHDTFPKGVSVKGPDGRDVLVCQAGEYMKFLGRLDLKCEPAGAGWRVASVADTLVPLDDKIKMDPAVTALIARQAESAPKPQPAAAK